MSMHNLTKYLYREDVHGHKNKELEFCCSRKFVMRKLGAKPLRDAVSDMNKSTEKKVKDQYKSTRVKAS